MKRFSCILLSILLLFLLCFPSFADWPEDCSIRAESGILMDADSGAILYAKDIHTPYYPASITKILTALVVLENSPDLNEMVTFSKNAVYNVEEGSSNAGLSPGDQLSIQDCLYALLLKSANEAANALAEHIAGTIPHFVEMMNAKAEQLGCVDSHFANPSGLNDSEHYTSAYDMALIAKAAFSNSTLTEIASTTYYDLPPLKQYPEGQTVYIGHKMLKKNFSSYYPYAIAGKTGYTSLAGNTLVTYAKKDGMRLVAVILKGANPYHYSDTKTLFDFGFQNFKTLNIAEYETSFTSLENDLSIAGISTAKPLLTLNTNSYITIPKSAEFADAVSALSYQLTLPYPSTAVAELNYNYEDHFIGRAYLEIDASLLSGEGVDTKVVPETLPAEQLPTLEAEEDSSSQNSSQNSSSKMKLSQNTESGFDEQRSITHSQDQAGLSAQGILEEQSQNQDEGSSGLPSGPISDAESEQSLRYQKLLPLIRIACILLAVIVLGACIYYYYKSKQQKRLRQKEHWKRKQQERLFESGYSTKEFNRLLEQRRKEKEQSNSSHSNDLE